MAAPAATPRERGYAEPEIGRIAYGNWERVLRRDLARLTTDDRGRTGHLAAGQPPPARSIVARAMTAAAKGTKSRAKVSRSAGPQAAVRSSNICRW